MKRVPLILATSLLALAACKLKPTYPAASISAALRHICAKEYKLSVETRQDGGSLQAYVYKAGLFRGESEDLQGMSKDSLKALQDVLMGSTRIALSTDAKLDFIEIRLADLLTGATLTIWRYVPDIKDSMRQSFGEMEYFNRLVVDVQPGEKQKPVLGQVKWAPPISLAEFLAKQVLMRARREGAERLKAHVDLSDPTTLAVVVENWKDLTEDGAEEASRAGEAVYRTAQNVLKGYRFVGFRNLVLRDGRGNALQRWAF